MKPIINLIPERAGRAKSYLIDLDGFMVLIDAGIGPDDLDREMGKAVSAQVRLIALTHGHYDHIAALGSWQTETEAEICASEPAAAYLAEPRLNLSTLFGHPSSEAAPDIILAEGERVELSGSWTLQALLSPGHTPGDLIYLLNGPEGLEAVFTGDVLFAMSVGRTDFPGGDYAAQASTLERLGRLLSSWPSDLLICPGHDRQTTAAALLRENPWLGPTC